MTDCESTRENALQYADGTLTFGEAKRLEAHLRLCPACSTAIGQVCAVFGVLEYVKAELPQPKTSVQVPVPPAVATTPASTHASALLPGGAPVAEAAVAGAVAPWTGGTPVLHHAVAEAAVAVGMTPPPPTVSAETPAPALSEARADGSFWSAWLVSAPWWAVSAALHVLAIALIGLLSMDLGANRESEAVVMLTEMQRAQNAQAQETKPKAAPESALESKRDVAPTDPASQEHSEILVPPDLQAELGDHFETLNPDRPDTANAYGNEESHIFYSITGNAEAAGGGGNGGVGLEDVLGIGGPGSAGSGGGWGGGSGGGIGPDKGVGRGSFGARTGGGRKVMVKRHGGSAATESAVEAALRWLAYHQENEGLWMTKKYLDNKEYRYGGNPELSAQYDVGVTGLATLAFLGAGHSLQTGPYRENVQRAINWLMAQQGPDGNFAAHYSGAGVHSYCHCIATLACAEALAMNAGHNWGDASADKKTLRQAVEKGVELILAWQTQNPDGAWSYPHSAPLDPTVTGWAVMALKSARIAGINVPADALLKALAGMKRITTVDNTKTAYGQALVGYRAPGMVLFASKGYALTAAGMVINLFLGADRVESNVDASAELITQEDALPAWVFKPNLPQTDHQNLYYWYYGTLGCFQAGGQYWKKWNEKMKAALVPNQCRGGDKDKEGSWNPDDVWGAWGGRVYSTALGALCLEVYYRYQLLKH